MREAVFIKGRDGKVPGGGLRTPFIDEDKEFRDLPAAALETAVINALIDELKFPKDKIQMAIGAYVGQYPTESNLMRMTAYMAGLEIPAYTINMNCGSSLRAVRNAVLEIERPDSEINVILAGAGENMSRLPFYLLPEQAFALKALRKKSKFQQMTALRKLARQIRKNPMSVLGVGIVSGLTDPLCKPQPLIMGKTAERVAKLLDISRELQDRHALRSHRLASLADQSGRLAKEIAPVWVYDRRQKKMIEVKHDSIRHDANLAALEDLDPMFEKQGGSVTAGNASKVTDGADAMLIVERETAKQLGYPILGRIVAYHNAQYHPELMGLTPVPAIAAVLAKAKKTLKNMRFLEINDAFKATTLGCLKIMGDKKLMYEFFGNYPHCQNALAKIDLENLLIDGRDILNVNGSAVALGHPVGATNMRQLITTFVNLGEAAEKEDGPLYGLIAACVGGGLSVAAIVEYLRGEK